MDGLPSVGDRQLRVKSNDGHEKVCVSGKVRSRDRIWEVVALSATTHHRHSPIYATVLFGLEFG